MIEIILNIPILFFIFGVIAVMLKSNLKIPSNMIEGITMYLMLAIGIKGGISLASESLSLSLLEPSIIVISCSIIVATYVFYICKKFLSVETSAAIAATYGSNSTMTFITAASFLSAMNVLHGGSMTIALVLMETPAIIYGIYLANKDKASDLLETLKNAVTDGTHLLLIGSLIIGYITTTLSGSTNILYGFVAGDIFTGALCFFLLSMGLKVGNSLRTNIVENLDWRLISLAAVLPWVNGFLGYIAGYFLGLSIGDLFLTTMLMASASYIVAPAIMQKALPSAEIGKYLTMSIAITFPINILLGIPFWWNIISAL